MIGEERSPFSPPASSKAPLFLVLAALSAGCFAAYRWHGWSPVEPAVAPAPATLTLAATIPADSRPLPSALPLPAAHLAVPSTPSWTRCEVDGRVVYSDGDCQASAETSSSTTSQAALSTVQAAPSKSTNTTLYRCKSYAGELFWSSVHCNQKKALVDRMVEVPRALSFQQQIGVAKRSLPKKQAAVRSVQRQQAAAVVVSKQSECESLDAKIRKIDAITRQPLSGPAQDRWRAKRQTARDRQFALHC